MQLQGSIDINTSPEKVWGFLTDPDRIRSWYLPLVEFEFTCQHRGAGTTFYYVEEMPVGTMKLDFEVTEWEENERIEFHMTAGEFLAADHQSWMLEKTPDGCRFIFREDAEFPYGILGKFMGIFARIGSQANVNKMLAKLKSLAESGLKPEHSVLIPLGPDPVAADLAAPRRCAAHKSKIGPCPTGFRVQNACPLTCPLGGQARSPKGGSAFFSPGHLVGYPRANPFAR
jgi:uncharacterized protein YndB with AHSA1/START domain